MNIYEKVNELGIVPETPYGKELDWREWLKWSNRDYHQIEGEVVCTESTGYEATVYGDVVLEITSCGLCSVMPLDQWLDEVRAERKWFELDDTEILKRLRHEKHVQ